MIKHLVIDYWINHQLCDHLFISFKSFSKKKFKNKCDFIFVSLLFFESKLNILGLWTKLGAGGRFGQHL